MRSWQLAAPLAALGLFACILDTAGLRSSDDDDATTATTTGGGFGGSSTSGTTSASSATTSSTTSATTTGAGGMGGMPPSTGGGGEAPVGWGHRRPITVQTATNGAQMGYSLYIDIDHQALVSQGQSLANGDDVYVAYDDGSGPAAIDRVVDPESAWNQPTTRIWFETRTAIAGQSSDSSYYLYWDHPTAPAPPQDYNEVFRFFDTFDAVDPVWTLAVIGTAGSAQANLINGQLHIEAQNIGQIYGTSDDFIFVRRTATTANLAVRAKVTAASGALNGFAILGGAMIRETLATGSRFRLASPATGAFTPTYGNRVSTHRLATNQAAAEAYATAPDLLPVVVEATRTGNQSRAFASEDGLSFAAVGSPQSFTSFPSSGFHVGVAFTNDSSSLATVSIDWFLERRFVYPEPTATLGSVETGVFPLP